MGDFYWHTTPEGGTIRRYPTLSAYDDATLMLELEARGALTREGESSESVMSGRYVSGPKVWTGPLRCFTDVST